MSIEELFGPDETDSEKDEEDDNDVPSKHDDDSDIEGQEPPTAPARDDQRPAQENQEAPFNTNNVEEDGHVNADGVDYRQPRAPFNGCVWCGTNNAFIRTDEQNTSKLRDGLKTAGLHLGGEHQWLPQDARADARGRGPFDCSNGSAPTASRHLDRDALRPGRAEQLALGNGLVHRCAWSRCSVCMV